METSHLSSKRVKNKKKWGVKDVYKDTTTSKKTVYASLTKNVSGFSHLISNLISLIYIF
jgi:hypothetical protein